MRILYDPRQSVPDNASFSPSAGKPAAFVEAASRRFGTAVEVRGGFQALTEEALALAHDPGYVADVLGCRADNGFGNRRPSVAASLPWTTASLHAAATAALAAGGAACSPTSGFHHACYASGMGFCTFNGLVVASVLLKRESLVDRVAIVDFDMHYGNGTDDIIERLGLDWLANHSLGGFAGKLGSSDAVDDWLDNLEGELDEVAGGCDLVLYQAGADPHVDDPLGGLLSSAQMRRRDRVIFSWAASRRKPLAWNLAGGYQQPLEKVLELHLATAEECLGVFR